MTSSADKAAARAAVRARRSQRDAAIREAAAWAIADHAVPALGHTPGTVTAYRSLPGEPGTGPLIDALAARGDRVLLPRIVGKELEWVAVTSDSAYARGPLGISEPVGPAESESALPSVDVLFIPGLGVDHDGWRLGQGGGYYDKALASVTSHADGGPLRIAVLFDEELVDAIPHDDHDCRVDAVVTPGGLHWLTR